MAQSAPTTPDCALALLDLITWFEEAVQFIDSPLIRRESHARIEAAWDHLGWSKERMQQMADLRNGAGVQ